MQLRVGSEYGPTFNSEDDRKTPVWARNNGSSEESAPRKRARFGSLTNGNGPDPILRDCCILPSRVRREHSADCGAAVALTGNCTTTDRQVEIFEHQAQIIRLAGSDASRLLLGKVLGRGTFGKVYGGVLCAGDTQDAVAVKVQRRALDARDYDAVQTGDLRVLHDCTTDLEPLADWVPYDPLLGEYTLMVHAGSSGALDAIAAPICAGIIRMNDQLQSCMVMQRVGPSLDDAFPRGIADWSEWRDLALASLRALRRLHECSVFHGDIKPANICLAAPGSREIKLIDFGFAGTVDEDPDSGSMTFFGTPAFSAIDYLLGGAPYRLLYDVESLAYALLDVQQSRGLPWDMDDMLRSFDRRGCPWTIDDLAQAADAKQEVLDDPCSRAELPAWFIAFTDMVRAAACLQGKKPLTRTQINALYANLADIVSDNRLNTTFYNVSPWAKDAANRGVRAMFGVGEQVGWSA
ncbi:unnamed protein product [Pedinophyceae sp. YPF-701]|nr:unnamed protein product [Pedinophyceae sp. YPF-701]